MSIQWPLINSETGRPKTTPTNQSIWMAAMDAAAIADSKEDGASDRLADEIQRWKERISQCKSWRQDYYDIVHDFVKIQAKRSPQIALEMCRAGLNAAQEAFVVAPVDGALSTSSTTLNQAFASASNTFETKTVKGTIPVEPAPFRLALPRNGPSSTNATYVTAHSAAQQIQKYAEYGCMEPSAAARAQAVCEMSDTSSLVDKITLVLLGATSEMGPVQHLSALPHAHVLGVARSVSKLKALATQWHEHAPENSLLQFPSEGADMLKQAPAVAQWIVETAPPDRALVLYPLAYMDGEANVRLTVAMDAILQHVQTHFTSSPVHLAYLTSPYTAYTIPPEAARDARDRYNRKVPAWHALFRTMSLGKWLVPSRVWEEIDEVSNGNEDVPVVLNGLARLQGPNYALAKTLQQWRCMLERGRRGGCVVAAPHAPPTRTDSVLHSAAAAAGLEGLSFFSPMVAFDVEACSSLMTAIVLHQLSHPSSGGALQHPMQALWDGAVHGGNWRCPYTTDSCSAPAYLLGRTMARNGSFPLEAMIDKTSESERTAADHV